MADSDLSQSIASLGGNAAEDYVESVMGSQQIERVERPVTNARKRQLSTPGSTRDEGSDTVCNYTDNFRAIPALNCVNDINLEGTPFKVNTGIPDRFCRTDFLQLNLQTAVLMLLE